MSKLETIPDIKRAWLPVTTIKMLRSRAVCDEARPCRMFRQARYIRMLGQKSVTYNRAATAIWPQVISGNGLPYELLPKCRLAI